MAHPLTEHESKAFHRELSRVGMVAFKEALRAIDPTALSVVTLTPEQQGQLRDALAALPDRAPP